MKKIIIFMVVFFMKNWFVFCLTVFSHSLYCQINDLDTIRSIKIKNGSFERNNLAHKFNVEDWVDCGKLLFPSETPPDIHPNNRWKVTMSPDDRKFYLGMVVRDNGSHEQISQKLNAILEKDKCYEMTISLAQSDLYESLSHVTNYEENYDTPAILQIFGGNILCEKNQLLASSVPIDHHYWKKYIFKFKPNQYMQRISFAVFYNLPITLPYNGNILIDNISDIREVECENK